MVVVVAHQFRVTRMYFCHVYQVLALARVPIIGMVLRVVSLRFFMYVV